MIRSSKTVLVDRYLANERRRRRTDTARL